LPSTPDPGQRRSSGAGWRIERIDGEKQAGSGPVHVGGDGQNHFERAREKGRAFPGPRGADGKPVKTSLDSPAAQASGNQGGRLKQRIVAKKKEEYEEYADRMKELAQHYIPPDKDAIQEAYSKGNIAIIPGGNIPGEIKLVIHNYYKKGDTVTLRFYKDQKQLQAIAIASWMDDPKDGMNLTVDFGRLPDGTNHVSNVTVEGVSKQLTVNTTNSDYRKL
jgi:hypothetical protein